LRILEVGRKLAIRTLGGKMSGGPESSRPPLTSSRGSLREIERRRSERLLLTVPIRVEGVDRNGEKFSEDTRTLIINRQGARIFLKRAVTAGVTLLITNSQGRRSAKFRVVGPTQPMTGEGGEWGMECLEENANIWGIGFPPTPAKEGMCTALIECRKCQSAAVSHLSMVEHEVLGTSGLLLRECAVCGRATSWGYREPSLGVAGADPGLMPLSLSSPDDQRTGADRRVQNRVALQLPIRVRSYYGTEELTRTENVSRSGVCFLADRTYEVGEILLITCPYERGGHNIEVRGRVVRRQEMRGTGCKIYGVCYER
jgi:hypothetical protein